MVGRGSSGGASSPSAGGSGGSSPSSSSGGGSCRPGAVHVTVYPSMWQFTARAAPSTPRRPTATAVSNRPCLLFALRALAGRQVELSLSEDLSVLI